MNEILLINKDKGLTSRDVVNILSKIFNEKKIGHFGTLDPLATGLLVIGIGAYTKLSNILENEDKEYLAEVLIGVSTDTYDITGKVLKEENKTISQEEIIKLINSFKGKYMQEVPIYSAVKVNGKKLYEYIRENKTVTLPKKEVDIKEIEFIKLSKKENKTYFTFRCKVSKGTYIRSLINDMSKKINIPLCMSNLKRTKCGDFKIEDAYTLNDIKENNFKFVNIKDILDIEEKEIPDNLEKLILNGTMIDKISNKMILFTKNNQNIALYGLYKDKMKPYLTFKK